MEISIQDLFLIQQHFSNIINEVQDEMGECGDQIMYLRQELEAQKQYQAKLEAKLEQKMREQEELADK